jgi:hypothetical protein
VKASPTPLGISPMGLHRRADARPDAGIH